MKKLLPLTVCILLICVCSTLASAEEAKYSTAGDLYEAWCENLPDYICGIWSTDGGTDNLTFGIQNNDSGNAGKEEMLKLVADDSSLRFVYQQFSRNYLLQIQKEIDSYFEKDLGLISTGLDEYNNCIELGILEERKQDAATQNMITEITGKYGKAVSVVYTGAIFAATVGENMDTHMQPFLFLILALTVCACSFLLILGGGRNRVLLQTRKGTSVFTAHSLSSKKVEQMVKESTEPLPPDLDQKILDAIGRNKQ